MSKVRVFLLISALASLTGCAGVVSLHPLAAPNGNGTVFDPALLGTWVEVNPQDDGAKTRFAVARAESGYKRDCGTRRDQRDGSTHQGGQPNAAGRLLSEQDRTPRGASLLQTPFGKGYCVGG